MHDYATIAHLRPHTNILLSPFRSLRQREYKLEGKLGYTVGTGLKNERKKKNLWLRNILYLFNLMLV